MFLDDPVDQLVNAGIVERSQKRAVFIEVFEMWRIEHRRLDNVIVDADI